MTPYAIDFGRRFASPLSAVRFSPAPRLAIPESRSPLVILVGWFAQCLSCGRPVELGKPAHWVPALGVWHSDCECPAEIMERAQ